MEIVSIKGNLLVPIKTRCCYSITHTKAVKAGMQKLLMKLVQTSSMSNSCRKTTNFKQFAKIKKLNIKEYFFCVDGWEGNFIYLFILLFIYLFFYLFIYLFSVRFCISCFLVFQNKFIFNPWRTGVHWSVVHA